MFDIRHSLQIMTRYFLMEHTVKLKTVTQVCHIKINQTLDFSDINKQCWQDETSTAGPDQWEKTPASFSHLIIIHDSFLTCLPCVAITSCLFSPYYSISASGKWVCNSDVINCCCLSRRVGALHLRGLTPVDEFYMKTSPG